MVHTGCVTTKSADIFEQIPRESPEKWRDMLAEFGPELSCLRLSYARGANGSFMASGDDVLCHTQTIEGSGRMMLVAEGQGIKGQFSPSSLADELHAAAYQHWANERMATPELKELRCSLTAIDKDGAILHSVNVKLRAKKPGSDEMWVSEEELHGSGDPRGISPREQLNLRRQNEFLMGLVTKSAQSQMAMAEAATQSHASAQMSFEGNMVQISERVQFQKKELEDERDERIADARGDRMFKMAEFALMAWMMKQGMPIPPGMFQGAPGGMPGATPPSPPPTDSSGDVVVESRVQTLAREILELSSDQNWSDLKLVNLEVASDLHKALLQHQEGADDVEAALAAVLPATLPHAQKFAQHLPQEVIARVLEINQLLSS